MKQSPSEHAERWLAENRAALDSSNAFVEAHGLPLERHQAWRVRLEPEKASVGRDAQKRLVAPADIATDAKAALPPDAFGAAEDC